MIDQRFRLRTLFASTTLAATLLVAGCGSSPTSSLITKPAQVKAVGRDLPKSTPTPLPTATPTPATPTPVPATPPPPPVGHIYNINAPVFQQHMNLDCESAALSVALRAKGINVSEYSVFDYLPKQPQDSKTINGVIHWGNPYQAFVGNVNGPATEGFGPGHGYGVYYGPIAAASVHFGAPSDGHTGWTAAQVEAQIALGNPVIIWVHEWNGSFPAASIQYWTSWDGQQIPYNFAEHTVTVVGWNQVNHTVTVVDVGWGVKRVISESALATALTTFGGMAVAVS